MLISPVATNFRHCGENGRQMFYEYLGQYFAKEVSLKLAPAGAVCPLCGSTEAKLYLTASGKTVCSTQTVITSKRCGRKSADEPVRCVGPDERGMDYFNETTLAIAGPHVARIATKVLPTRPLPPHVEVFFPQPGDRRRWLVEMLRNPPKPPFVFIAFGKNAEFSCDITTDTSRIIVNGPDGTGGYPIDRAYVTDLIEQVSAFSWKDIKTMAALRDRMASGEHSSSDLVDLEDMRQTNALAILPKLPSPGTRVYSLLNNLLND